MRLQPLTVLFLVCFATLGLSVYLRQRLAWLRYKERNLIQAYTTHKRRYFTLYHQYMKAIAPNVIAHAAKHSELPEELTEYTMLKRERRRS